MKLLDGKSLSEKRLAQLTQLVSNEKASSGNRPGLVVIRVGNDPASEVYVTKKIQTCLKVGFYSEEKHLKAEISEAELLREIDALNRKPEVHGILVQLPLPKHLSEALILEAVSPHKDVDGFHPYNMGRLVSGTPTFVACTPLGIMNLLEENQIKISGQRALVIGRSRIVGRPMSLLLDQAGATVTVAHSKTVDLPALARQADILVSAMGKPQFITAEFIKEGAVVVDVGINRLPTGKLVGDIDFESVKSKASAITPVPGGVGPMTICTLLENTWKAFREAES